MANDNRPKRLPAVLFVCLGNICRSPLAEAAFRSAAAHAGLEVQADSAGTGNWHVCEPPDPRASVEAKRHGLDIATYRARQVTLEDCYRFTHIFALDHNNLADLRKMAPVDAKAELALLLDWVPGHEGRSVADPYFGEADGFTETWREVSMAAEALVDKLGMDS